MPRYGDYETTRELSVRGLTSIYVAQRVAGCGPPTAVVKVLRLPKAPQDAGHADAPRRSSPSATAGHDLFISHSTHDKETADAICAALEASGLRCWIAPRNILPGANWASSILKAIAEARAMVLVFSETANGSPHIRREVERAVHHNIPIAPIRLDDVMPKDDLEYFLSASHWMDALTPPFEQHLGRLADDVRALISAASGGANGGANGDGAGGGAATARTAAAPATRAAVAQFLEAAGVQRRAGQV